MKKYIKCYSRNDKILPRKLDKRKAELSLSCTNDSIEASILKAKSRKEKRKRLSECNKENRTSRATYVSKPIGLNKSSFTNSNAKETKIPSVFDDWELSEDSPFSKLAKSVRKDPRLKFVKLSNFPSPTYGAEDKFQSSSSGCLTNSGSFNDRFSASSILSSETGVSHSTPNHLAAKANYLGSKSSGISGSSSINKIPDRFDSWRENNSLKNVDRESHPKFCRAVVNNVFSQLRTPKPSVLGTSAHSPCNISRENYLRETTHHGSNHASLQPLPKTSISCSKNGESLTDYHLVLSPSVICSRRSEFCETSKVINSQIVSERVRQHIFFGQSPSPIVRGSEDPLKLDNSSIDFNNANVSADIIYSTPIRPLPVRKWSKEFKRRRQAIFLPAPPLSKTSSGVEVENTNLSSEREKEESESSQTESNISISHSNLETNPWDGIYSACNQRCAINFSNYLYERGLVSIDKVGEGVFSEVFGCLDEDGVRTVWKIQPFEGDIIVNGEEQKKSNEIFTEILITKYLSNLRLGTDLATDSFVESLDFKCVHGPYPDLLLELWDEYSQRKGSENDCPSVFSEEQLFLVTELEYAGICLEDFQFSSSAQAISAFFQVAYALAIAEMAFEFEHRDLHWGNIMICKTTAKYVSYKIKEEKIIFESKGVLAKIVDFTLSRASINDKPVYADLSLVPEIFESSGEYQFEIYRLMKTHTQNVWSKYTPYTNILWLHYLVLQMCSAVKYRFKTSKIHKQFMKILKDISSTILDYSSVTDFVNKQMFYDCISIERDPIDIIPD